MRHVERYGRARKVTDANIVWHMLFACWISKAIGAHSECVLLVGFPRQQFFGQRTSMYTFIRTLLIQQVIDIRTCWCCPIRFLVLFITSSSFIICPVSFIVAIISTCLHSYSYMHSFTYSFFLLFVFIFYFIVLDIYQLYSIADFFSLGRLQNMTYSTTSCAEFTKTFLLPTFHNFHKVEFKHCIPFTRINVQMEFLPP